MAADVSSSDGALEAFTLYDVRVVAVYMDSSRMASEVMMVRTGTSLPDPPTDVQGTSLNNMVVSLLHARMDETKGAWLLTWTLP